MSSSPTKPFSLTVIVVSLIAVVVVALGALCAVTVTTKNGEDATAAAADSSKTSQNSSGAEDEEVAATAAASPYIDPTLDPSYYQVINRTYPIEEGYIAGTGELSEIEGKQMETNAAKALAAMVADLRDEGMSIIIQSGYRSDSDQEYLYNRQIERQDGNRYKAATISALPLTSEHQAGLAVDLSTDGTLLETFAETAQGKWLKEHCSEYGFILRYLPEKTPYTGIINEPWHFRFVGSPDQAQAITDSGLCMEEYFNQYLAAEDIDPYLPYLE